MDGQTVAGGRVPTRMPLKKLTGPSGWNWSTTLGVSPDGSAENADRLELIASALLNLLDEAQGAKLRGAGHDVNAILINLREIRVAVEALARPKPSPPDPRPQREADSRRRAWEAYLKAGGTMSADDGDDVPPRPDESILTLQLSYRARRALQRDDINTVGELLAKTAGELMALRNFGETSLANVRAALARRGLRLKGDPA